MFVFNAVAHAYNLTDENTQSARNAQALRELFCVLHTELTVDDAGVVTIAMRPTPGMCTLIAGIMTDVEETVACVPGVSRVRVSLHGDTTWPEADSENGRRILEARRQRSRAEVPVRPHE